MRTALNTELFPDCEVVEMPLHNQWIYSIQKNGSSSLRIQQSRDNLAMFVNEKINDLDFVDVYIREPRDRYINGINTYLQFLKRDHPELDYKTAFWFARRYKFLNTHYLPQFYWIANLSRYLHSDAKIRFRNFQDFGKVARINAKPTGVTAPSEDFIETLFKDDVNIEFWLFLDQILWDLCGQELSWQQLLNHYQDCHPNIIKNVLPKT